MYFAIVGTLCGILFLISWACHGFYILSFLILIYIGLIYLRRDDRTGYATYDWLRRLSLWRRMSPVNVMLSNEDEFSSMSNCRGPKRKYVFVVLPNFTNTALVWTFGLHGRVWPGAESVRPAYILPHSMFWLPGMREILMASGAVSDRGKTAGNGLEDVVIDLIALGRSVAYSPSGMTGALSVHRTDVIETRQPSLSLFRMAIENELSIVPVLCDGENDRRYVFFTNPWIRRIQSWFLDRIAYPFPLIFFPNWTPDDNDPFRGDDDDDDIEAQSFHYHRMIDVQFGDVIESSDHDNDAERMQRAFFEAIGGMSAETKEVIFKI